MLGYFFCHAAIHASWGYKFRVRFTAGMNIAFAWMRHHGFVVSWLRAESVLASRISEALTYMLIVFNLTVVTPRALTIGKCLSDFFPYYNYNTLRRHLYIS